MLSHELRTLLREFWVYLSVYRTSYSEARCIIQRVNKRVFQDPEKLLRNFRRVTEHVQCRLEKERDTAARIWQLPQLISVHVGLVLPRK